MTQMSSSHGGKTLTLKVVDKEHTIVEADCNCVMEVGISDAGVSKVTVKLDCSRFPQCQFPLQRGLQMSQTFFDSMMVDGHHIKVLK